MSWSFNGKGSHRPNATIEKLPLCEILRAGTMAQMTKPGNAAVLSLLIPGVGQIYNGKFLRGIFWLIIAPGLWIGSGGTLGWICHVISAYTAYSWARRHP